MRRWASRRPTSTATGRADFFVANDGSANAMWMNRGGSFEDIAFGAGVAVNADGDAEAGMGVAVADVDADGDSDVFLTHDVAESNTLYVNEGLPEPMFLDRSVHAGVAAGSLPFTGFGTGAFDFDNDGDLDLFVANGPIADFRPGSVAPTSLHNLLLMNTGTGRFQSGARISDEDTSRGAAFGDLDNDGDIDVVVANNNGPARLYRNDGGAGNWLGIAVRGSRGQRNAIGAEVWRLPFPELRRVRTDGSYASANDPRIVFGLGKDDQPQFGAGPLARWIGAHLRPPTHQSLPRAKASIVPRRGGLVPGQARPYEAPACCSVEG